MKVDIFNKYADKVTQLFGITKEGLFSKSKERSLVDARYLLFYLCHKRPMSVSYIQKYMFENGYDTKHTTILYGIKVVQERINADNDYQKVAQSIEKSVSI